MARLSWKLPELLEKHGVEPKDLARVLKGKVGRATVYRWAEGELEQINLTAAGWAVWGLNQLTGKKYKAGDLLEYEE